MNSERTHSKNQEDNVLNYMRTRTESEQRTNAGSILRDSLVQAWYTAEKRFAL